MTDIPTTYKGAVNFGAVTLINEATGTSSTMALPAPTSGYRLLHNLDAMFSRTYRPGDRLADGYSGDISVPPTSEAETRRLLEDIWVVHNSDDRPDGQTAWSLSCGDVVVLGEVAWSVSAVGFDHVQLDPKDLTGIPCRQAMEAFR